MKWCDDWDSIGPSISVPVKLIKAIGAKAAILVSQLYWWRGKEASKDGWIHKTLKELENETALSNNELDKCLVDLKAIGVLETQYDRKAHRNHFRINRDALSEVMALHAKNCVSGEGARLDSSHGTAGFQQWVYRAGENTGDAHARVRSGSTPSALEIPLQLQTESFLSAWADWDAYRQSLVRRFPWTQRAKELALKECEKMGADAAIEAIKHSIISGWRGLFAKPAGKNGNNAPKSAKDTLYEKIERQMAKDKK